jgi:dsDNA-specific endonuclease/ATPase MutS2
METDKPLEHALQECEDKVRQLEEENQHLRDSSHAFGQLAERLNRTLEQERRLGVERRESPRPGDDRRSLTVRLQPDTMHDRNDD